ncbi:MAG TPA: histidine phosphatase family protein [Lacibacter sp.]|nr:histidine phosphatase family protein [Lacibacter sp.]
MKQLLLIRHAKSSWADAGMKDVDRPLNERGKKDAPDMAQRLLKKQVKAELFLCSTAMRAQSTCAMMMKEMNVDTNRMILKEELYLAPPDVFYDCIQELDDQYNTVAMVAHNPGITDFVNGLTDVKVDDMPTCAVYAIRIETESWRTFKEAKRKFCFFEYPKKVQLD